MLGVSGLLAGVLGSFLLMKPVATQVDPDYIPDSLKADYSAAIVKETAKLRESKAKAEAEADKKVLMAEHEKDLKIQEANAERDSAKKEAELSANLKVEKQKTASRKEAEDALKSDRKAFEKLKGELQDQLNTRLANDLKEDEKRRIANSLEYKEVLKKIERERDPFDAWLANEDARNERNLDDIQDSEDRRKKGVKYNTWRKTQIDAFDRRIKTLEERRKKLIGEK